MARCPELEATDTGWFSYKYTCKVTENKIGDEVTITALPNKLTGKFMGWRFGNSSNLITQNPYT